MTGPWWELHPGRLEYELEALTRAGIAYKRDEAAFARGIVRLELEAEIGGERLHLGVTFPELYPYFRFEVDAPGLDLEHHQNPFHDNLCLIGRGTFSWHTTDTLAALLRDQLPAVLETGRSMDKEAALGRELQQAEPFGDFYPYAPSVIIIPGDRAAPRHLDRGTFIVATDGPQGPAPEHLLRGALIDLRAASGERLLQADPGLLAAFPGKQIHGYWVRADEPIRHANANDFLREILRRYPSARSAEANRVDGGWMQVWGVVFPEEIEWRTTGDGWAFLCLFDRRRSGLVSPEPRPPRPASGAKGRRKAKRGRGR